MNSGIPNPRLARPPAALILLLALLVPYGGLSAETSTNVIVLEIENKVEVQRGASTIWDKAYTNQPLFAGDSIKTSDKSRAILQLYDLTRSRVDQNTLLKITSPPNSGE